MSYNSDVTRVRANDVAIIGMAGRFPRAPDVRRLWENLAAGKAGVVDLSDEELLRAGTDVRLLEHPDLVKRHGVLEDIEWFDAGFFGFTPREAEMLDPQHRLFLECAWEALEGAGYDPQRLERITGMYAGMSSSSYDKLVQATLSGSDPVWQFQAAIALDKDFLTTRVSHRLNLTGPSITVQTACSSSLVAVHLACQSLVHGECDMALAGAAAVSATQRAGYLYREGSIASPDGRCRAFDARAQGTVSGSGVAIVVLKPLAAALEDGDHVHAVIRGSAVNNDGSAKVGFTAPSIGGQAKVIAEALAMADVEPRTIGYVEAHGTGTPLGDPIEIAALNQVFYDCPPGSCVVGALKTNLGHLDTAAGVAGLIKVALALEHGFIPPTLHFERPNPHVDFAGGPFYVSSAGLPWPASGPRRAGVSSFGIGGTNAHVVLEEAPRPEAAPATRPWCLLPLSARTPSALRAARARLAAHLEEHSELALPDVSFTLQTGRSEFQERFAVVARDIPEAVRLLRTGEDAVSATAGPPAGHAVFLFPGQGAQHAGMTAELYAAEPGFREQVNVCCALLREELGLDLRAVIYPAEGEADAASERLEQTALTQPALFVVEYALARLWMARGLQPEAMLGHSVGEYVAACLAGVFTLEDALRLVAARGRLMQSLPGGAMLAVAVGEKELEPLLGPDLSLAAVNGPTACVVAGPAEAVQALRLQLERRGIPTRALRTSHAFHSPMMDPAVEPFREIVAGVSLRPPQLPFVSNVTGRWITPAEAMDPAYWARHLRAPVRFAEGVRKLLQAPGRVLLEVGPGRTLERLVRLQPDASPRLLVTSLPHPKQSVSEVQHLLRTAAELWCGGIGVRWSDARAGERRLRVPLPTYPFERQRYWIDPRGVDGAEGGAGIPPLGGTAAGSGRVRAPSWRRTARPRPDAGSAAWLVLADAGEMGERLACRLRSGGERVVVARPGERLERVAADAWVLDPRAAHDYRELLAAVGAPVRVVHLWSLPPRPSGGACAGGAAALGPGGLRALCEALAERGGEGLATVCVVTAGAYDVTGAEPLAPEAAAATGLAHGVPRFGRVVLRSVDLAPDEVADGAPDRLLAQLEAEVRGTSDGAAVAYRAASRWVRSLEPVVDPGAGDGAPSPGFHLLATAGIGPAWAVAESLAHGGSARFLVATPCELPPESEWDRVPAPPGSAVGRVVRGIRRLRELGAEVLAVHAGPRHPGSLERALADAGARWGGPSGLVYQQEAVEADSDSSLAAEGAALGAVLRLARDYGADGCVLVAPAPLQGRDGAAVSVAHALAEAHAAAHNRTAGAPCVTVAFDGPGAAELASGACTLAEAWPGGDAELRAVARSEGVAHYRVLLSSARRRHDQGPSADAVEGGGPADDGEESDLAGEVEEVVAETWRTVLGIPSVGRSDDFFALGGHSLLGVQIISRLREEFQADVPMDAIFTAPTVAKLAALVTDVLISEIDRLTEEEARSLV